MDGVVCRYWLYLGQQLSAALESLPAGFQQHILWAFSTRAKQQDMVLCRLSLFLDPRYRQAAKSVAPDGTTREFLQAAAELGHKQGWSQQAVTTMGHQMQQYGLGQKPFDAPCGGPGFDPKMWWLDLAEAAPKLSELACILLDVVPHAAQPERTFSTMGWFEGGQRTWLSAESNAKLTAIKMYYDSHRRDRYVANGMQWFWLGLFWRCRSAGCDIIRSTVCDLPLDYVMQHS